ncbi:YqeB family protein [Paenibacillus pasadenensis]|uniref:DUF308 domain-containing protein n=1 Tax=Paenibacillus pasadenensis TaxID=217090 RepID=A0A2N5NAQ7_9BACL|nr:hypothetical protein [Paenibacillus pasadenensis]PLT47437.1 hypothetical protein B8V81_1661 [Paenibacillus pasadenensis]
MQTRRSGAQRGAGSITVVHLSAADRWILLTVPPALGIALGYFVPAIAGWAAALPWFPLQGPLELIASIEQEWIVLLTAALGLIAGCWLASEAMKDSLAISVSDEEATLKIRHSAQSFPRSEVAAAFIEGKQLVLVGRTGVELAREPYDADPARAEQAFIRHGYAWSAAGDPFEGHYRLWVRNAPDLTPALNALLEARELALRGKEADAAREMKREAARLGLSVKDKGTMQYWRKA